MTVYLDMCAIQRPLDTPDQIRIVLESDAVLGILALCEDKQLELVSSDALFYETEHNPLPIRKEYAKAVLSMANRHIALTEENRKRAEQLINFGIKPLDALHLAMAEEANVDYFCTCDDRLLRKARKLKDIRINVVSPLEFIQEIEK